MLTDALITPVATFKIGRKHALHRVHIGIENNRVIVRTKCGIDPTNDGFTETFGIPTCDDCEAAT